MLVEKAKCLKFKRKIVTIATIVLVVILIGLIVNKYLPNDLNKIKSDVNDKKIKVSIIGDSISTYDGYSPHDYFPFYPSYDMTNVNKTWWYKVINEMNFELGFNSSWGATTVACTSTTDNKCFSSDQRVNDLGRNGTPDYIIIFGGTNDLALSEVGSFDNTTDVTKLIGSYYVLINKIKTRYPNTEIIAIIPTGRCEISNDKWLGENGFYNSIKKILENNNIRYIDLNNTAIQKNSSICASNPNVVSNYYLDTLHPNESGMTVIKNAVVDEFKKEITVTFNKNDGTGGRVNQSFKKGVQNQSFGKNTDGSYIWGNSGDFGAWEREGYELLGWSSNPNATTPQWYVYSNVSDNWIEQYSPKVNIYGVWQKRVVTAIYNSNDGTGATATQKFTYGIPNQAFGKVTGTDTLIWGGGGQFNKWDRQGYKLLGWSTNPNATTATWDVYAGISYSWINDVYDNKSGVTPNKTINLYAVWQPKTITVTFNKNDGTNATATQKFTIGVKNQRFGYNPDGTPKWNQTGQFGNWDRVGYELLGWSSNPKATLKSWDLYSNVTDNWINQNEPNITIYAVWQPKTITVIYNKNDGTGATAKQGFTVGIQNQAFGKKTDGSYIWGNSGAFGAWNRKGYKLLGWSTSPTSKTAIWDVYASIAYSWIDDVYDNQNGITPNQTINLYAIWQGGTAIPTCTTKTYNGSEQVLFSAHTSGNYTNSELKKKSVGTYSITLKLVSGNFWKDGTTTNKTIICKINKATPKVKLPARKEEYTGSPIAANTATVTPYAGEVTYTYYNNNLCTTGATTNVPSQIGQYYVQASVQATNNTNAAKSKCTFHKIVKYDVKNTKVNNISNQIYTGSEIKPQITVKANNITLISGTDYTISYRNNIEVGTATIVIKGKGNYTGEKDIMFRIIKDTTPTIDNIKIVEDRYSILNKDETKETVTDLVGNIQITSNNTVVNENDKLKTGDVLKVNDKEYQIAVLGDTNKDGKINISDLTRTYKIYNQSYVPSDIERLSADTNEDQSINIGDLTRLYKLYNN